MMGSKEVGDFFGQLPNGRNVFIYTLRNASGMEVRFLNYGATLTSILVPDAEGKIGDVCLGYSTLEDYLAANAYCGAMVGPVAGRVGNGVFRWGDQSFQLTQNELSNHLHGGHNGFDKQLWEVVDFQPKAEMPYAKLVHHHVRGTDDYPANIETELIYRLNEKRGLEIEIKATTDAPVPFAPTSHTYFNLSAGGEDDIDNHILQIKAAKFLPIGDRFRLESKAEPVQGGMNDFREPARLGGLVRDVLKNHGDMYVVRPSKTGSPKFVARVDHPPSGRSIEMFSTEPCLQFYSGRFLGEETVKGKQGRAYPNYAGLCLEAQGCPESKVKEISSCVLQPEDDYHYQIEYRFGLVADRR